MTAFKKKVLDAVKRLNHKREELIAVMQKNGYTSLGHEGRYAVEGRTFYDEPRMFGAKKVAAFTSGTLDEVTENIIKEIDKTIAHFSKPASWIKAEER